MAEQQHPITPPPELVLQWVSLACEYEGNETWIDLATQAARWGADRELESCCAAEHTVYGEQKANWLRSLRRPKPPTLVKQAETALLHLIHAAAPQMDTNEPARYIRAALERLQQLELENHD